MAAPLPMAYYPDASGLASLKAEATTLKIVAADSYDVTAKGVVSGSVPTSVRTVTINHKILLLPTVSNWSGNNFQSSIAKALLTPGAAQNAAITAITALATKGFGGINIDFESVPHKLRPQYTAFVQTLAAALHKESKILVLSVPAKTADDPNDSWAGAYDFASLAPLADILQVMTYDENGPWGAPGPVAGLDWVTQCIDYTKTVVPLAKISMGMPAYGYDWNTTKSTGVTINYNAVPALIAATGATVQWDTPSSSPWFTYNAANGDSHTVWYENPQSITAKAQFAALTGVQSVSEWALGEDNAGYWKAVEAGFSADRPLRLR